MSEPRRKIFVHLTQSKSQRTAAILFCLCLLPLAAMAKGIGFGGEIGVWKPSDLDRYPSRPLKNVDGAKPYLGGNLILPIYKSHVFRLSFSEWRQKNIVQLDSASVALDQLAFDLKYLLLPPVSISPYVSYGASVFWSRQTPKNQNTARTHLERPGWGFEVGAGIDFLIGKTLSWGVEYQYLYAKFIKRIGLTNNYSGPRVSMRLSWFF
ncbi:MAG: porin family protein [candidate division KSB1 bacterium]|nr:porin family protein [candidate division KSB1 bacterium]